MADAGAGWWPWLLGGVAALALGLGAVLMRLNAPMRPAAAAPATSHDADTARELGEIEVATAELEHHAARIDAALAHPSPDAVTDALAELGNRR